MSKISVELDRSDWELIRVLLSLSLTPSTTHPPFLTMAVARIEATIAHTLQDDDEQEA